MIHSPVFPTTKTTTSDRNGPQGLKNNLKDFLCNYILQTAPPGTLYRASGSDGEHLRGPTHPASQAHQTTNQVIQENVQT